jgi:hypothetical protein
LKFAWDNSFYQATVTLGADPEFVCIVGNRMFRSMVQVSEEFISTSTQITYGPVTTALGYVVDRDEWATPPIHVISHFSHGNIIANATLSYFDKWYQSTAVCWHRGHVAVGWRTHASPFMPRGLKDVSFGTQFNFTRTVTMAIGCCRGNVMFQCRKKLFDQCYVQ